MVPVLPDCSDATTHGSPRENGMSEGHESSDPLEFFRKMWNPMSFPMPGMFQPTMDPEEVDKKIFELQAVENWLKMNLSFVQMTVKTLEMQRSALQSLKDSAARGQAPREP
jgi:hypothetical protein